MIIIDHHSRSNHGIHPCITTNYKKHGVREIRQYISTASSVCNTVYIIQYTVTNTRQLIKCYYFRTLSVSTHIYCTLSTTNSVHATSVMTYQVTGSNTSESRVCNHVTIRNSVLFTVHVNAVKILFLAGLNLFRPSYHVIWWISAAHNEIKHMLLSVQPWHCRWYSTVQPRYITWLENILKILISCYYLYKVVCRTNMKYHVTSR